MKRCSVFDLFTKRFVFQFKKLHFSRNCELRFSKIVAKKYFRRQWKCNRICVTRFRLVRSAVSIQASHTCYCRQTDDVIAADKSHLPLCRADCA